MRITTKVAAAAGTLLLLGSAPLALAHGDDTSDPSRCDDSAARGGHEAPAGPADVVVPLPGGYELWAPGGHYVLRGPDGYVEVVGGQGYNQGGNQGGYVQGEVDPAGSGPDADFQVNSFAGQNSPNASGGACVNANNTRVATPGYSKG